MTTKHWSKPCLKDLPLYESKHWNVVLSMRESKAGKRLLIHMPKSCSAFSKELTPMQYMATQMHRNGSGSVKQSICYWSHPQIKRKIAYLEGATFSELWQKACFEKARLRDLENATNFNPAPKKYHTPIDDRRQGENPYQRSYCNCNFVDGLKQTKEWLIQFQ